MNTTQSFSLLRQKAGLSIDKIAHITGYSQREVYRWEKNEVVPRKIVLDQLTRIAQPLSSYGKGSSSFTFIDLFAGIGGMRKAFEELGGRCVYTSEWDKYSRQTYLANFECDHEIGGDITKIDAWDIPSHDILVAGFPCQPFSIAGVSKKNALGKPHGFADKTQGTLFFDVARIIDYHRPKAILLENVKNLQRHDKGKTFEIIKDTLAELGYYFDWKIIDAGHWVPQHRERIFIVGFREDCRFSFDRFALPANSERPVIDTILHSEDGMEDEEPPYTIGPLARISDRYTLSDHLWQYLRQYAEKHRAKGNGFGFGLVGPHDVARTLSARYYKDGSEILVKQDGKNPRRLTPRECSRLMGFDSLNGNSFVIPVSDTQAYRQFGNAVVVPVVRSVALYMLEYLVEGVSSDQLRFDFGVLMSEKAFHYG
ncbi:MAG: DNA (cytosine-5-)-methyltransferase [Chlorobium sp.]|nr:MAG: DNA (cytosine-5-)-methyltransferase [Chlorobium sp.]